MFVGWFFGWFMCVALFDVTGISEGFNYIMYDDYLICSTYSVG